MLKLILFCVLNIILFSACGLFETDNSVYAKYEVSGSAQTVFITYENQDGGTSQRDDVKLPWSHSFQSEKGAFVYISAQNLGDSGDVRVTIFRDGVNFKSSSSSGAYVIATASGNL
jgi:hypothetical protein